MANYPLRLCIVTDAWNQMNGVVTTLTNLIKEAEADGWEVLVIHPEMFFNIELPFYKDIRISFPFRLKKIINDFSPTYLHIATEGPLGLCARLGFRRQFYTTAFHTQWAPILKDILNIPETWTWKFLRWFHSQGKVMVPTLTVKNQLISKNVGTEVVLFSRGVDLNPSVHRIKNTKPRLLSVGRISKEKNLEDFCSLDSTKYELIMVGDGPYLETLKRKFPNVEYKGAKFGTDLANEYALADVMVFTSKKDTFGLVIIEAQTLGTPVAAYPVSGPLDVIVKETGAMSDDINESIAQALTLDRDICAKKACEMFSWKSAWNQFKRNLVNHT